MTPPASSRLLEEEWWGIVERLREKDWTDRRIALWMAGTFPNSAPALKVAADLLVDASRKVAGTPDR